MRNIDMNNDDLYIKYKLGILGSNHNHIADIHKMYQRIMPLCHGSKVIDILEQLCT